MATLKQIGNFIMIKNKSQTTPVLFSFMTMINYENVHKKIVNVIKKHYKVNSNLVTLLVFGSIILKQILMLQLILAQIMIIPIKLIFNTTINSSSQDLEMMASLPKHLKYMQ